MTQLLTIDKAAEKIGVTPRQIRHWITIGELQFMRIGRRIYLTEAHFEDLIYRKTERNLSGDEIVNGPIHDNEQNAQNGEEHIKESLKKTNASEARSKERLESFLKP